MGKERNKKKKRRESSSSSSASCVSSSSESESSSSSESQSSSEEEKRVKKQKDCKGKEKAERKKRKVKTQDKIDKGDYYNKSQEFRTWLREKRGKYFDELPSDKAKVLFKTFVKKWNSGQLGKKYYQKRTQSSCEAAASRTRFKWKFAQTLDEVEMGSVRDEVEGWTVGKKSGAISQTGPYQDRAGSSQGSRKVVKGPSLPPGYGQTQVEKEEQREKERSLWKKEKKQYKEQKKMVLDELLPKATGRQAVIEKRMIRVEKRREREQSPELDDAMLMGGSDSYQRKLEARKKAIDRKRLERTKKANDKLQEYQKKEQEKMNALIELAKARGKDF